MKRRLSLNSSPAGVHETTTDTSGEKKTELSGQETEVLKTDSESPTAAGTSTSQKPFSFTAANYTGYTPDNCFKYGINTQVRQERASSAQKEHLMGSKGKYYEAEPPSIKYLKSTKACDRHHGVNKIEETAESSARAEHLIGSEVKYCDERKRRGKTAGGKKIEKLSISLLNDYYQLEEENLEEDREHIVVSKRLGKESMLASGYFTTKKTSTKSRNLTQASSLPDKCEEFTPEFIDDERHETYRFLCSSPGLYRCTVTSLVFHMEGEGEVFYRTISWNSRLLSQHHKKPAGPLFDIKCQQQTVSQLHLPHCEILSTGGGRFLSVAHVNDEKMEFIVPQEITETHVIINITGFSGFGNIKDEDSPSVPVRALVLLFYRPPDDPDEEHLINVLMLPKNVSIRDVLRTRKTLVGDEMYIETSPHCKLQPKQVYTLSAGPGDVSVLVQPSAAEFDEESYDNYFPAFQVTYETVMKHMKLFLRDSSCRSVWERRVCLSTSGVRRSCGSTRVNLRPHEQLLEIRSNFIDGVSGPVLQSLLDKLLEKRVMADSEREEMEARKSRGDKARYVLDTVRNKGEAASSQTIEFLCEVDPFLCEHLGLM